MQVTLIFLPKSAIWKNLSFVPPELIAASLHTEIENIDQATTASNRDCLINN